jgi:hypothetical protein
MTLNGIAIAWTVHHHDTSAPCCEVTVTVSYTDPAQTANPDGSHTYSLGKSVSSQRLAAVIDSALETKLTNELQTFAASKFNLTLAQVQALTTRTVSADYPAGS